MFRMRARAPWFGAFVGATAVIVISAAFFPFRDHTANLTVALVLMAPVVGAALLSGRRAAVLTALLATAAMDVAFITPFGTLRVALVRDVVTLLVFVVVALA